jgi:hypothetical protein
MLLLLQAVARSVQGHAYGKDATGKDQGGMQ